MQSSVSSIHAEQRVYSFAHAKCCVSFILVIYVLHTHTEMCCVYVKCLVMWVKYCSRRVVCIFHVHMQSCVSLLLHRQSRVYEYSLLSHAESWVFFMFTWEPCKFTIAHAEYCVVFMFTCIVVRVYYCTRRVVCNVLICVYFPFSLAE